MLLNAHGMTIEKKERLYRSYEANQEPFNLHSNRFDYSQVRFFGRIFNFFNTNNNVSVSKVNQVTSYHSCCKGTHMLMPTPSDRFEKASKEIVLFYFYYFFFRSLGGELECDDFVKGN